MTSEGEIAVALAGSGAMVSPAGPRDTVGGTGGVVPACIACPGTLDQAAGVLQAATSLDMAVVPRGSGRTISWGLPPARCDVIADLTRMNQILEYAAGDLVVRAQAGVTLGQLAETLAEKGQRLALDGPPGATVGGVVARNAAGPLRLRYGLPRDLLIGITIVRADGHVAKAGGKVVKNVAGYDLGKLFAGSNGTLGLIAEATFRLHPLADFSAYVTEKYQGSADAAAAVLAAAASPLQPSAVELHRPRVGGPIRVATLLEGTPSGVSSRSERMRTALGRGAETAPVAPDWWGAIGETGPGPGGGPAEGTAGGPAGGSVGGTLVRVAFWAAELRRVLDAIDTVAADTGVRPAVGGAAGAGVLYASLPADEDPGQVAMFVRALRAAAGHGSGQDPAALARGSVVVLTAPGAVQDAVDLWGPVPSLALMRAVKQQFDPGNLMAPGRGPGGI